MDPPKRNIDTHTQKKGKTNRRVKEEENAAFSKN